MNFIEYPDSSNNSSPEFPVFTNPTPDTAPAGSVSSRAFGRADEIGEVSATTAMVEFDASQPARAAVVPLRDKLESLFLAASMNNRPGVTCWKARFCNTSGGPVHQL